MLTTSVGTAIRAVEQRLGIVGNILGFLGGIAWAIASFLVVPVVVAEDLGPMAAVKRSAQLIRSTWGTSLRTTGRPIPGIDPQLFGGVFRAKKGRFA